jgi:hypothetical protein
MTEHTHVRCYLCGASQPISDMAIAASPTLSHRVDVAKTVYRNLKQQPYFNEETRTLVDYPTLRGNLARLEENA